MPISHIESGISPVNSKAIQVDSIESTSVFPGTIRTIEFTPPAGYIWNIVAMYLSAPVPVGGFAGEHKYTIQTGNIFIVEGKSDFMNILRWDYSHWSNADSHQPADDITTLQAILSTKYSHEIPIKILYTNNTDIANLGSRVIRLYIIETSIY